MDTDELIQLITRARAGDHSAYDQVVRRFQDMAVGYSYAIVGDFHLAQDAAQEAFLDAYVNLAKLRLVQDEAASLIEHRVKRVGALWMVGPELLELRLAEGARHPVCPKCGQVHHFRVIRRCTGARCGALLLADLGDGFFRHEYMRSLEAVVGIQAEEHSGQIDGAEL